MMIPLLQAEQLRTLAAAARDRAAELAREAHGLRAQAALFETLADEVLKPRAPQPVARPRKAKHG